MPWENRGNPVGREPSRPSSLCVDSPVTPISRSTGRPSSVVRFELTTHGCRRIIGAGIVRQAHNHKDPDAGYPLTPQGAIEERRG